MTALLCLAKFLLQCRVAGRTALCHIMEAFLCMLLFTNESEQVPPFAVLHRVSSEPDFFYLEIGSAMPRQLQFVAAVAKRSVVKRQICLYLHCLSPLLILQIYSLLCQENAICLLFKRQPFPT